MKRMTKTIFRTTCLVATAAMLIGCSEDNGTPPITGGGTSFAFVTTTDFTTGSSSAIWFDGSRTTSKNVAAVHSDAVARFFDGLVFVVNRVGGDNIQILDPVNSFSVVRQFSVGNATDPHDILVLSATKAYVTRYNSTTISIVNPSTGIESGTIDLSAFADADGIPEMDRMVLAGDKVFVTIQRLDRTTQFWDPVGESYLAVIDVASDSVVDVDTGTAGVQPLILTGFNPFSAIAIEPTSGRLCVSVVGNWGTADGGVEVVNPVSLRSEGYVIDEATMGGDITDVVMVSQDNAFAIYTDASFNNVLQGFNPLSGQKTSFTFAPGGFVLQDAALAPNGELLLTDRTSTKPGIRIFNVNSGLQITTDPIDVGLPPFAIVFGQTP